MIPGGSYNGHSLANAGAMIFDDSGNLWLNNALQANGSNDGVFEFTGPQNPNAFKLLNFTADANALPLGMDISPTNPPAPPFDPCTGCIVVAEFNGKGPSYPYGDVDQIDPHSCTGTIATPGTCQFYASTPFIPGNANTGRPKYLRFTENCNDTGYVEICKLSCATNPVSGYFDFTATNAGTTIGPVHIPVNACSGPIQIPNGTVTIKETQQLGVEVTNITAFDYDYLGNQINALFSYNYPFQTGNVNVVSGDVSTETVAGFTNCASGPGELKICKVAGPGVQVNQLFTFQISNLLNFGFVTVPAGPPPGGYCEIVGSYPVGTQLLISEPFLGSGIGATAITVAPSDRGGTQRLGGCTGIFGANCPFVEAVIDSGTTEVSFTNAKLPFFSNLGSSGNLYQCGSLNSGWPVAGPQTLQAAGFKSAIGGSVSTIDVAVTYSSGTNKFYVALYTNNNGQPGTQLASFPDRVGTTCGNLVTIGGISGVNLTAGQSYWLVVGPMASNTNELWRFNSTNTLGTELTSHDGGVTWVNNGNVLLGAFDILP